MLTFLGAFLAVLVVVLGIPVVVLWLMARQVVAIPQPSGGNMKAKAKSHAIAIVQSSSGARRVHHSVKE
jgi:hypothetical protein